VSSTIPQSVDARLTCTACFLVVTIHAGADSETAVRKLCGELAALVRGVGFRAPSGELSCVLGVGAAAWARLFGDPAPKELHPFREIRGVHHAPATPGDLLFHIRAAQADLAFELAAQIMERLEGAGSVVDETHGFKYFDSRNLLGFVDGTENPVAEAAIDATLIGEEDPGFSGGSYVIVQKYLHDLPKWNAIAVEEQERIMGRKKLSDIELDDAVKPSFAHNALTSLEENGQSLEILRGNMPFGDIGKREFGTYFIGYARSPARIEQMLENMFVGKPPGNYDRLLDVSRAVTGSLFFVPSATFLDDVAPEGAPPPSPTPSSPANRTSLPAASPDGSLRIGSLKDEDRS
jgi:porphyrinogen peroxidase